MPVVVKTRCVVLLGSDRCPDQSIVLAVALAVVVLMLVPVL
jgi:hypothetical protein